MRSLLVASVAVAVVLGSVAGCSSSNPGNQDAGNGLGFTIAEQIVVDTGPITFIYLSDRTGLCDLINSGAYIKSFNVLSLPLVHVDSTGAVVPAIPGVYTYVNSVSGTEGLYLWNANVTSSDTNCNGNAQFPSTGSATLTSINATDGGGAVGSYGMFFGTSHVQGNFDATYCNYTYVPLPDGGYADGGGIPPCL